MSSVSVTFSIPSRPFSCDRLRYFINFQTGRDVKSETLKEVDVGFTSR